MNKLVTWLLLIAVYAGAVAPFGSLVHGQAMRNSMDERMKAMPHGLAFRLSEAIAGAEDRQKREPTPADALDLIAAGNILRHLPAITPDNSEQTEFAKRAGSLPVPKTGKRVLTSFPSSEQRGAPQFNTGSALDVVRYSPDGDVSLAPDLSVTFSQPMIAVTSQEQAAAFAPVELTPRIEGRWRWLGTKTLMFDTARRFPMATRFRARVPAVTRSANGQTLAKDVTWTFTTPPPKVEQMFPQNQVVKRDSMIFMSFDQEINPEAVVRSTYVSVAGKRVPIRLANEQELAADELINFRVKQALPKRWIVFRAVNADGGIENALPGASTVVVTVQEGTPSAEGRLVTEKPQSFRFTTFGPLKFVRSFCGWEQNPNCSPFETWMIKFNNPVETASFTKELVTIDPPIEGATISPGGNYLYISGYKKGRTTYKVTVDGGLKDTFGQALGQVVSTTIKVGSAPVGLYAQGGFMSVLDPTAKPTFSIYSTNQQSVKVRIRKVSPQDWPAYQDYVRHLNYDDGSRPAMPGQIVFDKLVAVSSKPDEMVETRLDVSRGLDGGFGNVIIDVEPTTKRDRYDRTHVVSWLQATQIGLDAFVDSAELVGFATDLKTGKAISGVDLSIYPNGDSAEAKVGPQVGTPSGAGLISRAWAWLGEWGSRQNETGSVDANGFPLASEAIGPGQTTRTGANGILRLELPAAQSEKSQNILIARRGKDTAFLPENSEYYWSQEGTWYKKSQPDSLRWFVFDDRKMYKPNEEVSVKGYVRKMAGGRLGDIGGLSDAISGLSYSVKDPRGNEIAAGHAELNAFAAFDLKFKLPDNANLGTARIDLSMASSSAGSVFVHNFQIQEFRRPEFEVATSVDSEAPFFVGTSADVVVDAKYYAGGGLANADANWTVTATPTSYTPPNRGDYTFGTWVPWWGFYDFGARGSSISNGSTTQTFKGITDVSGKHALKIDFVSANPARPYNVRASAAVQDVNRQTWSSSANLLVHPSSLYVGIKTPRTFVQRGETIAVGSIVSDLDGGLVAGRDVEIRAVLKDWIFDKGAWKEETVDEQICTVRSAETEQACDFTAKQGGRYTIAATVMDDRERYNESELTVWVPGGKTPPQRNVDQEQVQIIPNKKEFAAGETAELLVIAPFAPAEGVLTLRREGIVKTERFSMKDSTMTLKILLEDVYLPNVFAQVDIVGSAPRTNDKGEVNPKLSNRPALASGNINLSISTESRRLTVSAEPQDKTLVPGGNTKVDVVVKDAAGEPVGNSEIAVVVVDESVLALSAYRVTDPVSVFYAHRGSGVRDYHSRQDVQLGNPEDVDIPPPPPPTGVASEASMSATPEARLPRGRAFSSKLDASGFQVDGSSGSENAFVIDGQEVTNFRTGTLNEGGSPIKQRVNFDALAVFAPSVKSDSSGRGTVEIKLPDNLTRYRITAVAVDNDKRFGMAESAITAKQPLMLRASAPRFMNFGDNIELPVVIQNQTDADMSFDVAVRATYAIMTEAAATNFVEKRVLVKANDRAEIRFPASASKAGTARFQVAATSGKYADAADISLPVWTPATTEAFATYGTTDQNGAILQPVQTPGDVFAQFGGLEVTTSSTQLQELTDAFIYLTNYPYACSEQIASRMISIAAMRDVLDAFKAKDVPGKTRIDSYFARDIEILRSRQRDDGSFGLWKRDLERYEYPFLTVHVAHALALAKAKGYNVPDEMIARTKPFLRDVEKHFDDEWYKRSPRVRWTISAYALYVRHIMGDRDAAKAKRLLMEATTEKLPFEALGWMLSVLADDPDSQAEKVAIIRFLMNRSTETAATANFVTDYGDSAWLIMYSNRRADGVLLEALIKSDPNNGLIPKLVRGLLDNRVKGAWSNTQENVFILLALDKYFNAFEKVTPDFVTRIWLGSTYAGENTFEGRSVDSSVLNIPMNFLAEQGSTSNLLIDRQGAGRLYYRIGMKYAPKNLKLDPADYGITVLRQYEAVDDVDDVKQNADGSWTIRSGARVRVRLSMVAQARRYHVALVDQLPAGLEILNPELAVTEVIPDDKSRTEPLVEFGSRVIGRGTWYWRQHWFEHQNFRDERAEAFASLLWEGVYNYTYVARATTPGRFVVPPAKAEEMYHPETFGRTGTDFVNVE